MLSYIPQNCEERAPYVDYIPGNEIRMELNDLIPSTSSQAYDIKLAIEAVVDSNSFFELQELYAENMVIGFARLAGNSIGIVANQPMVLAGCLDVKASKKLLVLYDFVIALIFRCWYLKMFQDFCQGLIRNGMQSFQTVLNCCMHSAKPAFRV